MPPLVSRNTEVIGSEMTCVSNPERNKMSFGSYEDVLHLGLNYFFFPLKCEGQEPILYRNRNPFLQTKDSGIGIQRARLGHRNSKCRNRETTGVEMPCTLDSYRNQNHSETLTMPFGYHTRKRRNCRHNEKT